MKRGNEIPKENTVRSRVPERTVAELEAKTIIPPRTGPMHGDHPAAKITPRINVPCTLSVFNQEGTRKEYRPFNLFGIGITRRRSAPNIIRRIPPAIDRYSLTDPFKKRETSEKDPRKPETAPKKLNTRVNPMKNDKVFTSGLTLDSPPIIIPKYPRSTGNVQGKNAVTIPVKKTARKVISI